MGYLPMSGNEHFHRGYSLRPHKSKSLINHGIISSELHCTGYLARIGTTNEGYALYICTQKPLGRRSAPIRRAYKVRLQRSRTTIEKRIAKIEVVVREIQKE